jgi:pentatricopeptide repeat protein
MTSDPFFQPPQSTIRTGRGLSSDVYLFSTTINVFCKGKKVEDAIGLFMKMEELGIASNVVTYNNIIHGLCKNRRLDEALQFRERMVRNNVNPSVITYCVLINNFIRLNKLDEANVGLGGCT